MLDMQAKDARSASMDAACGLKVLEERQGDQARKLAGWPKTPRSLSGHLKRLAPNLQAAGWTLEQDRSSKSRSWIMCRVTSSSESAPSSVPSSGGTCNPMQSTRTGSVLNNMTRMTLMTQMLGHGSPTVIDRKG
jgi:hypothetical protein